MYPDDRVANFINQNFIPVKIHIKENPTGFHRFEANWTPTMIVLDPEGHERYRFAGYLPADYYLAHLEKGLAQVAFAHKKWPEAERHYQAILDSYSNTDLAPEALYYAGVSKYQESHNPEFLADTGAELATRYPRSSWALRGSVWLKKAA